VLLEMDVAMLKEIDLVAFGRRVRVYNAIKELRHRCKPKPPALPVHIRSGWARPERPSSIRST
jgi:hypothetical protein